jgi:hypothetical protein
VFALCNIVMLRTEVLHAHVRDLFVEFLVIAQGPLDLIGKGHMTLEACQARSEGTEILLVGVKNRIALRGATKRGPLLAPAKLVDNLLIENNAYPHLVRVLAVRVAFNASSRNIGCRVRRIENAQMWSLST